MPLITHAFIIDIVIIIMSNKHIQNLLKSIKPCHLIHPLQHQDPFQTETLNNKYLDALLNIVKFYLL